MFKTALRSLLGLRSLPTFVRNLANQSRITPTPTLAFPFISSSNYGLPPLSTLSSPFSSSQILRRRHQDDNFNDDDEYNREPNGTPKLFVVQPRLRPEPVLRAKLEEALNLANSLEEQRDGYYETEFSEKSLPPHVVVQNPTARSPRADTFFGPGTVENVKCHINALESKDGLDAVFVNGILTGVQQRNLERIWGKPVLDRVGLIIQIFNAHAQTKEAKLQAELAALMYQRSRLVRLRGPDGRYTFGAVGEAEVVSAKGRGSGGRGFISGAGETELHLQRRRILERRNQLLSEIKEVRRTRALQRAARKRHGGSDGQSLATVAVVGYTNAGKSTLVSSLSDSYLYCDDRLFATVDPKLSSVILPSGRKVLLSDTVGFISDLPVQLVEAFHATLEEVVEADLLVHVLDSSSANLDDQRETVLQVLGQIGVSEEKLQNMIEVWNKIDLMDGGYGSNEYMYGGGGLAGRPSGGEDNDEPSDDDDQKSEHSRKFVQELDDSKGDYSDGWLLSGDELESWVDYDGSTIGQDSPDNQQNLTSRNWRSFAKDHQARSGSIPHIKTSAVTGVGLQELLELIDDRLKTENEKVPESNIFNCKWRPPRSEDSGIAVEQ